MKPEADNLYFDREQSQIKHAILEKYLQRFAIIVGSHRAGLIYVDGFSGPWNTISPDFADASFSIALKQLRHARDTVRARFQGKELRIQCVFLEKDPHAFAQLNSFAASQTDAVVFAVNKSFEDAIPELVRLIKSKSKDHFPFILIDPKGWKGFSMDVIKPLIEISPCEVLVNFMTGHLKRFIEDGRDGVKASFRRLFGDDSYERRIEGLTGQSREDAIVETYAERISVIGGYPYVSSTLILQPKRDRTHFHLVYATRNLRGLEVFKAAERQALKLAETVRADAKRRAREAASGQPELFGGEELPETAYLAELQRHFETKAEHLLEFLRARHNQIEYDTLYAAALKFPTVQEAFLKRWIKEKAEVLNLGGKHIPQILKGHIIRFRASA